MMQITLRLECDLHHTLAARRLTGMNALPIAGGAMRSFATDKLSGCAFHDQVHSVIDFDVDADILVQLQEKVAVLVTDNGADGCAADTGE